MEAYPAQPQEPQKHKSKFQIFLLIGLIAILIIVVILDVLSFMGKINLKKSSVIEQRIIYAIPKGDDYLSDLEIFSVKLDGTDKKLIKAVTKEELASLNSRIWHFYDSLILRGENEPIAFIDNQGNDLSSKYNKNNTEFGYNLDFAEPTLSPDGKKIAFILNGDKGYGSGLKTCSGGSCSINIRDVKTNEIETVEVKFDTWSYNELLIIGWTEDQKFLIGTGCQTTSCTLNGFEVNGTWALDLKTKDVKEYGLGGSPPFILHGRESFVYLSPDKKCSADFRVPTNCMIKLVDLDTNDEKTVAYNPDVKPTILRYMPKTDELYILEFNISGDDKKSNQLQSHLKLLSLDSEEVLTSELEPIFSSDTIYDVSVDGNYVIYGERGEDRKNIFKTKNLETGEVATIHEGTVQYLGLLPESTKRINFLTF